MAVVQIMTKYKGTPSGGHMAIGNVYVYGRPDNYIGIHDSSCEGDTGLCASNTRTGDVLCTGGAYDADAQKARLLSAVERAEHTLDKLIISVAARDRSAADILSVHKIMLRDEELIKIVTNLIDNEGLSAEGALSRAEDIACRMIYSPYDRSSDVREVLSHIRVALNTCEADFGKNEINDGKVNDIGSAYKSSKAAHNIKEKSIVVARDMLLSELVNIDRDKILALVTVGGDKNSHVSIVARSMGIPVITGCDMPLDDGCKMYGHANGQDAANAYAVTESVTTGMPAIADGQSGEFIINPDDETLAAARSEIDDYNREMSALTALKGLESITKSGRRISVCANINSIEDIESAIENDADGVGLFRSEGLYMGRRTVPTENELTDAYTRLLMAMKDKNVTVRTLDVAPDKLPECIYNCDFRGTAFLLAYPDILKTQLRAVYRASALCRDTGSSLSVMYPMIRTADEVREILHIIKGVESELMAEGVMPALIRHGIMVETPEAVADIDELASLVDFVSIGTNDLTRSLLNTADIHEKTRHGYAMGACKNANVPCKYTESLSDINSMLIKIIADVSVVAKRENIPVSVCGELASDTSVTGALINAGVDELSVRPTEILNIRRLIREFN